MDGRTDAAASVRPSVCHDSQRRRHGETAAIAVDVVAVRVCPSVRLLDGVWHSTKYLFRIRNLSAFLLRQRSALRHIRVLTQLNHFCMWLKQTT